MECDEKVETETRLAEAVASFERAAASDIFRIGHRL